MKRAVSLCNFCTKALAVRLAYVSMRWLGGIDGPVVTGSASFYRCSHACSVQACPANASCASGTATCFSHLQPSIQQRAELHYFAVAWVSEYVCCIFVMQHRMPNRLNACAQSRSGLCHKHTRDQPVMQPPALQARLSRGRKGARTWMEATLAAPTAACLTPAWTRSISGTSSTAWHVTGG